jgi:hypothetical protein
MRQTRAMILGGREVGELPLAMCSIPQSSRFFAPEGLTVVLQRAAEQGR